MSVEKVKGGYENIGKTGKRHGVMKSKEAAEKQKAAIFENDPKLEHTRVTGDRIEHHKALKEKIHKAVSDAFDKHAEEHGMQESELNHEPGAPADELE